MDRKSIQFSLRSTLTIVTLIGMVLVWLKCFTNDDRRTLRLLSDRGVSINRSLNGKIERISVSNPTQEDINLIGKLPGIDSLRLYDCTDISSLKPVLGKGLKSLEIDSGRCNLDISNFSSLENLELARMDQVQLNTLRLPKNLKRLQIYGLIESLGFLAEPHHFLQELELHSTVTDGQSLNLDSICSCARIRIKADSVTNLNAIDDVVDLEIVVQGKLNCSRWILPASNEKLKIQCDDELDLRFLQNWNGSSLEIIAPVQSATLSFLPRSLVHLSLINDFASLSNFQQINHLSNLQSLTLGQSSELTILRIATETFPKLNELCFLWNDREVNYRIGEKRKKPLGMGMR